MTQRKLRFVALMILALLEVPGFSQILRCKRLAQNPGHRGRHSRCRLNRGS